MHGYLSCDSFLIFYKRSFLSGEPNICLIMNRMHCPTFTYVLLGGAAYCLKAAFITTDLYCLWHLHTYIYIHFAYIRYIFNATLHAHGHVKSFQADINVHVAWLCGVSVFIMRELFQAIAVKAILLHLNTALAPSRSVKFTGERS